MSGETSALTSEWLLRLRPDGGPDRSAVVSSPATVAQAEADLGPGPVAWAVETAAGASARHTRQAAEADVSPSRLRSARRSAEACCIALLRGLLHDTPPDDIEVPPEAVEGNRDLVHRGVALDRVLRGVWTSQVHTYERLLSALRHLVEPDRWADESERVTRLSFAYSEELTALFTAQYAAEQERWASSAMAARRQLADDLLAGRRATPATVKRTLGIDLDHHHVAAILWSDPPEPDDESPATSLHQLAVDLIGATGATNSVLLPTGTFELWAWASWPDQPPEDLASLVEAELKTKIARSPAGMYIALGPSAPGGEGFRNSHLAARETERVAQALGDPGVYAYADIAVLSLLTAVPEHAERYMREVLGPLGEAGDKAAELRKTLRLYLAHGRSRGLAAEELFVAPNTVAYRVKRAEQLLGRPLPKDHLPLRLALEISRVIAP
ncbi:PucR family transcriptional regulator [Streptomyces pseudovenezuelae]|uniref:PucR family transcriptional regulator n=1 Tax=Streptomyces pseudovenezuelae TaxID=67350 RepID=UPI002476AFAC|nr:helix-turn-helix domain-containing protein [Streptomyces pseudovenezuelae]